MQNFKAMRLMSVNNMVLGMPDIKQPNDVCRGCLMSKQSRKSFLNEAKFTAIRPLKLVHGDLCGPILPCTPGGNKYIFCFD